MQGAGLRKRGNSGGFMEVESIVVWLIIGAVAGWLAGMIVKGGGFGLIGDIIVGIIGAVIAGWLLPYLHINIGERDRRLDHRRRHRRGDFACDPSADQTGLRLLQRRVPSFANKARPAAYGLCSHYLPGEALDHGCRGLWSRSASPSSSRTSCSSQARTSPACGSLRRRRRSRPTSSMSGPPAGWCSAAMRPRPTIGRPTSSPKTARSAIPSTAITAGITRRHFVRRRRSRLAALRLSLFWPGPPELS